MRQIYSSCLKVESVVSETRAHFALVADEAVRSSYWPIFMFDVVKIYNQISTFNLHDFLLDYTYGFLSLTFLIHFFL